MPAPDAPLTAWLDARTGARRALLAGDGGEVLAVAPGEPHEAAAAAAVAAAAQAALIEAGRLAGFGRLALVTARGGGAVEVAARREGVLLLLQADPGPGLAELERAALAWAAGEAPPPTAPKPAATPTPAGPPMAAAGGDRWADLRRALVRGQLSEATTWIAALDGEAAGGAGAEALDAEERQQIAQRLLQGIGSVVAGDGPAGEEVLEPVASRCPNLSLRWAALHWRSAAALQRGAVAVARAQLKEALELARQLDVEARGHTYLAVASLLAVAGDGARALAWLTESRTRFERQGDRWGQARTWLVEARLLWAQQQEEAGTEAAERAAALDAAWDEPALGVARRALLRGDLAAAERRLAAVPGVGSARLRALVQAVRQGVIASADARALLAACEALPGPEPLAALQRIAAAAPGFAQAGDALGWTLLRLGRPAEAEAVFRELLARRLSAEDRASAMLAMGCIDRAARARGERLAPGPATPAAAPPPGPAPAQDGGDSAVSGNLRAFALPDLLEFLRGARRTGVLSCASPAGDGHLVLRDGWLAGGASPATPRLGELLRQAGRVSEAALRPALERQADAPDRVLGELLVETGALDAAALQEALRRQIALAVRDMVGWQDGTFKFVACAAGEAPRGDVGVALDAQAVVLDVFRQLDEAARDGAGR